MPVLRYPGQVERVRVETQSAGRNQRHVEPRADGNALPTLLNLSLLQHGRLGQLLDDRRRAFTLAPADRIGDLGAPALRERREQARRDEVGEIGQDPVLGRVVLAQRLGKGIGMALAQRGGEQVEEVPEAPQIGFQVAAFPVAGAVFFRNRR